MIDEVGKNAKTTETGRGKSVCAFYMNACFKTW